MATQSYSFALGQDKTPQGIAEAVANFLSTRENMETQVFVPDTNGSLCVVQGRVRGGGIKQFLGLDKAITVRLTVLQNKQAVNVEIGEAKWGDKAAVLAVSMFVLWPLAITSAFGIYQQKQLPQKIIGAIQEYLAS